jgi:tetratricopeptide (TPR) repeat protein
VTVDEKNSPFEIKTAAKTAGRLKEAAGTLVGKKSSSNFVALAVRGKTRGPTLLAPRETKLLTATPRFQWVGMEGQPSAVKVSGAEGVIWSVENVADTQIVYPASAPALQSGVSYSWSAERRGVTAEKAVFSFLGAEESRAIKTRLTEIDASDGVSKTTLAILKGSFLISKDLYYDARETLLEAAKSDPQEPTLYFLLGEVYEKTGLKNLAQEAYSEAELLTERKP